MFGEDDEETAWKTFSPISWKKLELDKKLQQLQTGSSSHLDPHRGKFALEWNFQDDFVCVGHVLSAGAWLSAAALKVDWVVEWDCDDLANETNSEVRKDIFKDHFKIIFLILLGPVPKL